MTKMAIEPLIETSKQIGSQVAHRKVTSEFSVVSLFSGCGGMDLGFLGGFNFLGKIYDRLPYQIIWSNDHNKMACKTYEENLGHKIHCDDIWGSLSTLPAKADVVIGGFPCQDVSINGTMKGSGGVRTNLYKAMVEAIRRTEPRAFVAENVRGLLLPANRDFYDEIISAFSGLGYNVSSNLYLAADYGVPQNRERIFIVGTKGRTRKFHPPIPAMTEAQQITARQAIHDLEKAPECKQENHIWSRAVKSSEQGSRILKANEPADTMRAECHGNIQFHYYLPRRISMREAARFQSFPDDFIFSGGLREIERQVGNAVSPVLAWHIATALRACLL